MSPKNPRKNPAVRWIASGAAAVGIAVGAAGLASAATGNDSNASNANSVAAATASTVLPVGDNQAPPADAAQPQDSGRPDPATMTNGPGETLLTGTELSKVTAAAQAAEPGATIVRAETDSNGHTYEVHLQLADGSYKTLYFDSSYATDGSDTGFGAGPAGHAPADANATATTNG